MGAPGRTVGRHRAGRPDRGPPLRPVPGGRICGASSGRGPASVERVAAGAGPGRVRVVDRETLLLDRVDEVDGGAGEVRRAHLVGDHVHAFELGIDVAVDLALVEVELVTQARAAAWLNSDAKPQVIAALGGQETA